MIKVDPKMAAGAGCTKIDWEMVPLTQEELECIRVCVANAPIPYDITKKKIPVSILDKIGQPKRVERAGETRVEYDLTQYGIYESYL